MWNHFSICFRCWIISNWANTVRAREGWIRRIPINGFIAWSTARRSMKLIFSGGKKMIHQRCDVCGKREAVQIACSAYGATSYAFCPECLSKGLEPYGAVVSYIACAGHFPKDIRREYVEDVHTSAMTIIRWVLLKWAILWICCLSIMNSSRIPKKYRDCKGRTDDPGRQKGLYCG